MKKITKIFSAFIAAVMCLTLLAAVPASAETKTDTSANTVAEMNDGTETEPEAENARDIWRRTKELAGATYNSRYIKWMKKYYGKSDGKTVTFKDSYTKKYFTNISRSYENIENDRFRLKLNIVTSEYVFSYAMRDGALKYIFYADGTGAAVYVRSDDISVVSVNEKKAVTLPITEDYKKTYTESFESFYESIGALDSEDDNLDIMDSARGKVFRFRYNGKLYKYEEFIMNNNSRAGYLYNEKGNLVGLCTGELCCCLKISSVVKKSEFDIPEEYENAAT